MVSDMINTIPTTTNKSSIVTNPKSILGKDDFMKLLLTELKYQDPTNPMDTEKILAQTSQLATLESTDNTNKTLEKLSSQLEASSNLGMVSAIGKMGSLGTDSISLLKGSKPNFDLYFKNDIQSGKVYIKDMKGNIVKTFLLKPQKAGVLSFSWDGTNNSGQRVSAGSYSISANYIDDKNDNLTTQYGTYPISSVKFNNGKALLKLGNNYYSLNQVKEIYE